MACSECLKLDIPERLCMEGKSIDKPFVEGEDIYRRHNENIGDDLKNLDLKIIERLFKMENDSYNRSSLSEPIDVLTNDNGDKFPTWGIIKMPVSEVEKKMVFNFNNNQKECICSFKVVFNPIECNYSHCEIHCFIDGVRRVDNKPPKSARQFFRREILSLMRIEKERQTA